jgi:hypothetical protein
MYSSLYKQIKENFIPAVLAGAGIGITIVIGIIILQQEMHAVNIADNIIKGFCFDKVGEYNLSQYYQINGCEIVNCSNGNYTPCIQLEAI